MVLGVVVIALLALQVALPSVEHPGGLMIDRQRSLTFYLYGAAPLPVSLWHKRYFFWHERTFRSNN